MADHAPAQDSHHGHHVTPPIYYVVNVLMLMSLMALTIMASDWDLGATWRNNILALAIAITKTTLVILIFMGVKWQTRLVKLWAATGFVWFLLMAIIFGDYFTRDWESVPGWQKDQRPYPVLGSENRTGTHEEHVDAAGSAAGY
jgi:cytochrome c oxidase subunit IV